MLFLLFFDALFKHLKELIEFLGEEFLIAVIFQIPFEFTLFKPTPKLHSSAEGRDLV